MVGKNTFVTMLPQKIYNEVYKQIVDSFGDIEYSSIEKSDMIENCLNSRICDLEDVINVQSIYKLF